VIFLPKANIAIIAIFAGFALLFGQLQHSKYQSYHFCIFKSFYFSMPFTVSSDPSTMLYLLFSLSRLRVCFPFLVLNFSYGQLMQVLVLLSRSWRLACYWVSKSPVPILHKGLSLSDKHPATHLLTKFSNG